MYHKVSTHTLYYDSMILYIIINNISLYYCGICVCVRACVRCGSRTEEPSGGSGNVTDKSNKPKITLPPPTTCPCCLALTATRRYARPTLDIFDTLEKKFKKINKIAHPPHIMKRTSKRLTAN